MLLLNGLLFGVVNVACWNGGLMLSLWSFVAPHGALELPAIFIAGGAGLTMGQRLLFPGELPRRVALARAAALGVRLVLGTIPLLLVAGTMEGFVSPSNLPVPLKFAVSAALGGMLVLYLSHRPRQATASAEPSTTLAAENPWSPLNVAGSASEPLVEKTIKSSGW
jgi:hypothetical protein